jgi:predicted peroxiredoxin
MSTHGTAVPRPRLTGPRSPFVLGLAAAVLAGAFALSACAPAAQPAGEPAAAAEPSADAGQGGAAGTQPAGEEESVLVAESEAVLAWQDRWYDNFCSSAVVAMGDENCIGIAMEGVALAQEAPERIDADVPAGDLGEQLRTAATEAASAGDAFVAASCETMSSECVAETDDLTDAMRMYGDVVAEVVAAS